MKRNINSQLTEEFREWSLHQATPAVHTVETHHIKKVLRADFKKGSSLLAGYCSFNSYLITHTLVQTIEKVKYFTKTQDKTVGMFFLLTGSCSLHGNGTSEVINTGQQILYFNPACQSDLFLIPQGGQVQILEINFPLSHYAKLLAGYSHLQDQFISQAEHHSRPFIQVGVLPMTLPMKWLVNTILQCQRKGILKRLFLEAKILELLMLQVEQTEVEDSLQQNNQPKSSEVEALYEAKSILERSLDNPPSIKNLSKMVGMNEFNLKKGFKNTFDTTIYGYVNTLKMNQARQLLLEGTKSVYEVALLSGYKNPQHFTAAFKKFYGTLPSKIKLDKVIR